MATENTPLREEALKAFAAWLDAKEEIKALEEHIEKTLPEETARIKELSKAVGALEVEAKTALRLAGTGTYCGHFVKVDRKKTKTPMTASILKDAKDNGHLNDLIEAGFVQLSVDARNLDRLSPYLKTMYEKYIEETDMTPAVTMPKGI